MRTLSITMILFLLVQIPKAFSTHASGGDIRYEYVADSVIDVYFTFYRNCQGVKFDNPGSLTNIRCLSTGKKKTLSLTLVSITDITKVCKKVAKPCNPANTYGTGPGDEEHIYKTRIDFRDSAYSTFFSCGEIVLESGICCRSSSITTGVSGNFYNYIQFDIGKTTTNSSPVFNVKPNLRLCCNKPVRIDLGATDKDGDSLSYSLENPLTGYGTTATYSSGFSARLPLTIYDPTGKGVPNPNADPPIGFYLDKETGDVIFTPTSCNDVTAMRVKISEWRRDTSGKSVLIGVTNKEILLLTQKCQGNNPPEIQASLFTHSICEGDSISFLIKSDDKTYVPPPPSPKPDPDTVKMYWNMGIAGASFIKSADTCIHQSATFGWRVGQGSAAGSPYTFWVVTEDNNCPVPGQSFKKFTINVSAKPSAEIKRTKLGCGTYRLTAEVDTSVQASLAWIVMDSTGSSVDSTIATFSSTGHAVSTKKQDDLTIHKLGNYFVRLKLKNKHCSVSIIDTLPQQKTFNPIGTDDLLACSNDSFALIVDSRFKDNIAAYEWNYKGEIDTSTIFKSIIHGGQELAYLVVFTKDGCIQSDSLLIISKHPPGLKMINDFIICSADSIIAYSVDERDSGLVANTFAWSDGSQADSLIVYKSGRYNIAASNSCGLDRDTFNVFFDSLFQVDLGIDRTECTEDSVFLGHEIPLDSTTYTWSTGSNLSGIFVDSTGVYSVVVKNACGQSSDTIGLKMDKTPAVDWPDTLFYCNAINDVLDAQNPNATHAWDDGSTNQAKSITTPGSHWVQISSQHCGVIVDSVHAYLNFDPISNLGADTGLSKPFTIILDAGNQDANFTWSDGSTNQTLSVNDYGTYWVEIANYCDTIVDSLTVYDFVGIAAKELNNFKLYPNPNNGSFTATSEENIDDIIVYDGRGQILDLQTFFDNPKKVEVVVSNAVPGLYTVAIVMANTRTYATLTIIGM